ncbi:MAG: hypothetical protein U5J95_03900 [Balneolaceae bacterium]|nr:hypothetical protein [Balneolaceae bacterium]
MPLRDKFRHLYVVYLQSFSTNYYSIQGGFMRYIIIIMTAGLVLSCDSSLFPNTKDKEKMKTKIIDGFEVTTIDALSKDIWDDKILYEALDVEMYEGGTGLDVSSFDEVSSLLNSEIDRGIPITAAWYQEEASSCGTNFGIDITVVVYDVIVIELEKLPQNSLDDVFRPIQEYPRIDCPYFIEYLVPLEN